MFQHKCAVPWRPAVTANQILWECHSCEVAVPHLLSPEQEGGCGWLLRGWVWLVTMVQVTISWFMVYLVCIVFSCQYAAQLTAVGSSDSLWSKLLLQLLAPPPPSLLTPPHDQWYVNTSGYFSIVPGKWQENTLSFVDITLFAFLEL